MLFSSPGIFYQYLIFHPFKNGFKVLKLVQRELCWKLNIRRYELKNTKGLGKQYLSE